MVFHRARLRLLKATIATVKFCEPGYDHRGPWEAFHKITEEDRVRIAIESARQRMALMSAAAIAGLGDLSFEEQSLVLGFDLRAARWLGMKDHERCAWCGAERVLRFRIEISSFDRWDAFRPPEVMRLTT